MTNIRMTLLASVVVALAGCQSTSEPLSLTQETNQVEQSIDVQVLEIQKSYQGWLSVLQESDDLAIYSPNHFKELAEAWSGATEVFKEVEGEPKLLSEDYSLFSSKTYRQVFEENITKVEASFKALQSFKAKADTVLADSIAQMSYLDSIDTESYFSFDYKKLDSDYRNLFIDVRDDKLEAAQAKQVKFLAKAKQLEVKVNHKLYIEPLEKEAALQRKEGLSRVAPLTFKRVESEITLATNVVSTNPRDTQSIEKAVASVQFELKHVAQVAHQVKLLSAVEDNKFESSVLEMENNLYAISQGIDGSDYRDEMLRQQAEHILASVSSLKAADKTNVLENQLATLKRKVEQLEADNKKQAEALVQAEHREEQLKQQKLRDDQYIQRMDDLVASLKQLQPTATDKAVSADISEPKEAVVSASGSEAVVEEVIANPDVTVSNNAG